MLEANTKFLTQGRKVAKSQRFLRIILNFLASLLLCVFALNSSYAQTQSINSVSKYIDQVDGLTADEAVKFALENNDQLLAIIKDAEATEALINQANQRANPSLDANGLQQIIGKSYRYTIQGSIPLELGGRRNARTLVATREAEIKRKGVEQNKAEIAAEVRKQFGESLAMTLKLKLTEEMLASMLESYRLIQAKVKEGQTAPLEENMMLVEVNRLRSMREMDEANVQIALLKLRNIIGMSPENPLKLKGDLEDNLTNFTTIGELTERALLSRPDLIILQAMENLADAKIENAKTKGKFDANATLGYQRLRIRESIQFNYLVFGMKFTLPQRNKNRDAIEASVLSKQATEKRRQFGELVVKQEVATAYTQYNSAVRAKEIIRVGVVGEAEKNLNVVRQTYELGENSLLVFLAEQRRFIELKESFIDAKLQVYLARVEIYRATNSPKLIRE